MTPGQVTLGLFYPKTGAYATYARNAELVVQAAFNEVNERGGIHGRKLAVKSYDDGTGDAGTIRANERRARDETFAFLSLISQSNEILAGFVEQDRVPFVAGNISGEQARQLRYTFTPFPYWTTQARILPGFIKNHLRAGDRTIAVVFETSGPAQDAKEVFKATAAEQGLEVVFEQPIDRNQATCANEVNNLQSRNVGVVFVMAGPIGASCMLRDGRTLGYDPIWTGVGASWNLDITATATGGAADGIETLGVAPTLETPVGREFAQVMQKHYPDSGAETEDAMVLIYVMTQFYIEALEQTGQSLTRETFVSAIETKMNGWQTPYVPPPRFGPGDRSGADAVSVTRCCVDGRWVTPDPGWRTSF
ncbi:MAG: ABC transporter substrate-binding protein [Actinobacteria bacterium]|nr:ABC transporter substrate-binding protein [Actinomycetota bacterium]